MADNVTADPGSGGAVFATDEISSVHYPRSKTVWGPDGTANDADVAADKMLPTQLRNRDGTAASFNSGNKDAGTQRVVMATDQPAVPVNVTAETSQVSNAGTQLTPKFKPIGCHTSGENVLIAAVTSKKIRVLAMDIIAAAAVNLYFISNTGGSVIHGGSTDKINLAANGGFVLPFSPVGWFETSAGHDLIVNLSAANGISGGIVYVEV